MNWDADAYSVHMHDHQLANEVRIPVHKCVYMDIM